MSDELCGRCEKPMLPGDAREYYGWFVAHRPNECIRLLREDVGRLHERLAAIAAVVARQAEDDGLWFAPIAASEAYLQKELRRLHAAVEGER